MSEESKNDVVKEARELLSQITRGPFDVYPVNTIAGDTIGFRWGRYLSDQRDADHFWNSECVSFEEATFYARVDGLVAALCDEVEELRRRNATQEESVTHLQSQLRVMKEAIEGAENLIVDLYDRELIPPRMQYEVDGVREMLGSAITPKGSGQ